MKRSAILGAAAILGSALASPATAQEVIYNPGYCAQFYPNANCQNRGPGSPYTGSYQRQVARDQAFGDRNWRNSYNRWDGAANAEVGVAPGIEAYARRNGFVCIPGTWFRGSDGRQHICQ